MVHDHVFEEVAEGTLMRDRFEFRSPLGILGARRIYWSETMRLSAFDSLSP
jgi:ligand-binding SRPBCC domain-containing protein